MASDFPDLNLSLSTAAPSTSLNVAPASTSLSTALPSTSLNTAAPSTSLNTAPPSTSLSTALPSTSLSIALPSPSANVTPPSPIREEHKIWRPSFPMGRSYVSHADSIMANNNVALAVSRLMSTPQDMSLLAKQEDDEAAARSMAITMQGAASVSNTAQRLLARGREVRSLRAQLRESQNVSSQYSNINKDLLKTNDELMKTIAQLSKEASERAVMLSTVRAEMKIMKAAERKRKRDEASTSSPQANPQHSCTDPGK